MAQQDKPEFGPNGSVWSTMSPRMRERYAAPRPWSLRDGLIRLAFVGGFLAVLLTGFGQAWADRYRESGEPWTYALWAVLGLMGLAFTLYEYASPRLRRRRLTIDGVLMDAPPMVKRALHLASANAMFLVFAWAWIGVAPDALQFHEIHRALGLSTLIIVFAAFGFAAILRFTIHAMGRPAATPEDQ
jgi:hypothetical protein